MRNSQLRRREPRRELEIGEIGAAVGAAQPVLLLGEIVVADAGAVQLAQRGLGRAEIAAARRAAWRCAAATPSIQPRTSVAATGEQQRRRDAEVAGARQRALLAREQVARQAEAPPRHLVDPPQHRLDLAGRCAEAAALHGREQVALEHHAVRPAPLDLVRQRHARHSAATACSPPAWDRRRSSARGRRARGRRARVSSPASFPCRAAAVRSRP